MKFLYSFSFSSITRSTDFEYNSVLSLEFNPKYIIPVRFPLNIPLNPYFPICFKASV